MGLLSRVYIQVSERRWRGAQPREVEPRCGGGKPVGCARHQHAVLLRGQAFGRWGVGETRRNDGKRVRNTREADGQGLAPRTSNKGRDSPSLGVSSWVKGPDYREQSSSRRTARTVLVRLPVPVVERGARGRLQQPPSVRSVAPSTASLPHPRGRIPSQRAPPHSGQVRSMRQPSTAPSGQRGRPL